MANRLIKKTALYFVGNASAKVIQAILIPIYAFFVTSEALGTYDYYITFASLFVVVAFLATWESILKFVLGEPDPDNVESLVSNVLACVFVGIGMVVIICILLCLFSSLPSAAVVSVGLMILANGLATEWQYFARSLGQTKLYVASGVVSAAVNLLMVLLLVCLADFQEHGLTASFIIAQLSIVIVIESKVHLFKRFSGSLIDSGVLRQILGYSVPLIFNLVALTLLTGFGRLLIVSELGSSANGEYIFAMKFSAVITAVGTVFTMASIEESVIRAKSGELSEYYTTLLGNLWRLAVTVAIVALPFIAIFYCFLGDTDYGGSFHLVPIFIAFALFNLLSSNHGTIFQAFGKTRPMATSTIIGLACTVVTSLLTIDSFGLLGVSFSLCLGMFVTLLFRWRFGLSLCRYKVGGAGVAALVAVYVILSLVLVFFGVASVPGALVSLGAIAVSAPVFLRSAKALKNI